MGTNLMTMPMFPDSYWEEVFHLWYATRESATSLQQKLPPYNGKIPAVEVVSNKIRTSFSSRAAALDMQMQDKFMERIVAQRAEMFIRQQAIAAELQERAIQALEKSSEMDVYAALQALKLSSQMLRESVGTSTVLGATKLTDKQLQDEISKLLGDMQNSSVLDGEYRELDDE